MATTPGALGRRYLPFIALAAVQVLVIALAPSRGPASASGNYAVASGGSYVGGHASGSGSSALGAAGAGAGSDGTAATAGGLDATGGATSGSGGGGAYVPPGDNAGAKPDLSDCAPDGKQLGPPGFKGMPPCVPVWHGGDNHGATMTGVDATHIRYVVYKAQGNAQVNAILGTQGLAASAEQSCESLQAFNTVINKYYVTYGRKFTPLDGQGANQGSTQQSPCHFPYFQGQCSLTPPDPPCEQAEAKVIAAMHPAFVLAGTANPAFYAELAHDGIIVLGGGEAPESYYEQYAPYFYGLLMDSHRQALFDAEFWCKDLNGKPASYAGTDVTTTRNWGPGIGQTPIRKLAALFPETNGDPTSKIGVDEFKSLVTGGMCNTAGGVLEIPYQSDINTAQQQSTTIVQQLIQNHITTTICFCDPIAPVFLTDNESSQNYVPEQFIAGVGLIDYDVLGRLYSPQEWAHAFGVSDLALPKPLSKSDAQDWWNASGQSGTMDATENATVPFFELMATAFQMAGPAPTPQGIATALHGLPVTGGWNNDGHDPTMIKVGFKAPSPWTAAEDTRFVYWSASRTSEVDGKPGSYCPLNGGQRFDLNELPTGNLAFFNAAANSGC